MELINMYKNEELRKTSNEDMGFFFFTELPFYSTSNECMHKCLEIKRKIQKLKMNNEINEDKYSLLMKKFLKSSSILVEQKKRMRYLHLLKIRAFCSQKQKLEDVNKSWCNRVFPWMIFKVIWKREEYVLELDCIQGVLKLTNAVTTKLGCFIRMSDFHGALQIFDTDEIHLSYNKNKAQETIIIHPFDNRQTSLIIKYLDLFSQIDAAYLAHRRVTDLKPADGYHSNHNMSQNQPVTSQNISMVSPLFTFFTPLMPAQYECNPREFPPEALNSDLRLFSSDIITPPKTSFIEKLSLLPPLHPHKLQCYIAVGITHILFSLDNMFTQIFDVIKIDNRLPIKPLQDGVVILQEGDSEPRRLLFNNAIKGPLSLKIISEFQKQSYQQKLDVNSWPTPGIPSGVGEWVEEWVEELEQFEKYGWDGYNDEDNGSDKSVSDFDDVDSDEMEKKDEFELKKQKMW